MTGPATIRRGGVHPATAVVAAVVGAGLGLAVGGWAAPLFVALGVVVVVVCEPDLRERRIPNRMLLRAAPVLGVGLLVAGVGGGAPMRALAAVGWAAVVAVVFYLAAIAVPGGLGMGDVKLLTMTAVALGWFGSSAVLAAAAIGFGSAGVAGLVARRLGRWTSGVPFAPFHALGVMVVVILAGTA